MTVTYIISQIFALISFILSLVAYYRIKKEKIMLTMVVSNIFNLIHYVILGATTWYITKILAILRDSFIVLKEKKKRNSNIFLLIFVVVYIIVGVMNYDNYYSLLPLAAALVYIISIWNWDELVVKKSAFLSYFLRLIYNICIGSIVATIATIVSIISAFIAIIQYKKIGKNRMKNYKPLPK